MKQERWDEKEINKKEEMPGLSERDKEVVETC